MKRTPSQKGFSLIELLIVVAVILIIAAIAIPNLLRSKIAANEASAVASMRAYNTSIVAYETTYVTAPTTDLSALGPSTTPTSTAADLLDNLLGVAAPVKSGYAFTYTPGAASAAGIVASYKIIAVPLSAGTGQRQFFTDETSVIRQTTDGSTPSATSTPIG